jgi:hypothetical protein
MGTLKTTLSHDAILGITTPLDRDEGANLAKLCILDIDEVSPTWATYPGQCCALDLMVLFSDEVWARMWQLEDGRNENAAGKVWWASWPRWDA